MSRRKRPQFDDTCVERAVGENAEIAAKMPKTQNNANRRKNPSRGKPVSGNKFKADNETSTDSASISGRKPISNRSVTKVKTSQAEKTAVSKKAPLTQILVETNKNTTNKHVKQTGKLLSQSEAIDDSCRNACSRNNTETISAEQQNNIRSGIADYETSDTVVTNDRFVTDLLKGGLQRGKSKLMLDVFQPWAEKSKNMMHFFEKLSTGGKCRCELKKSIKSPVVQLASDLKVYRVASPFDRRVTALEWHPTKSNILGVGSKGGDIILWDTENVDKDKFVQGIGAAGSCQAMKFWPWDLDRVVSASVNGTVTLHDFEGRHDQILADTVDSYDHWYCSLDVNRSRYLVAAGRNAGILHLMSTEGRKVFEYRLHKGKITHVQFSPREDWLLCTASVDKTVQLWDVRHMKDRGSALHILKHEKPVNSAYFSQTDGCRLLTTDQNSEIRVYQLPSWHLETTIQHPHRFFQHISPFKATWHPLQDLIVCGRYPDPVFPGYTKNERRSLDIFDAESGNLVKQLYDPGVDGLCPLNKFNKRGDALATGMGFHIVLWNRKEFVEQKQSVLKAKLVSSVEGLDSSRPGTSSGGASGRPRPRPRGKKGPEADTDNLKKKTKSKSTVEATDLKMKMKSKTSKKEK